MIEKMSHADFNTAIHPKVQGSWNLHQQLPNLDFFIMLSSISGVLGNQGQANYSAGGTFQDALSQYRRVRGLPSVTIDLGLVKGVGYVADRQALVSGLERIGLRPINEKELHRIIEASIISPPAAQIVTGINTGAGPHWNDQLWAKDARFGPLVYSDSSSQQGLAGDNNTGNILETLSTLTSFEEVSGLILQALITKLSNMFMVAEDSITPSQHLDELGVDSLVAVELKNWLASQASANVSIFELMNGSSLKKLSETIASRSTRVDPSLLSPKA
jgi:acyl carrier protein